MLADKFLNHFIEKMESSMVPEFSAWADTMKLSDEDASKAFNDVLNEVYFKNTHLSKIFGENEWE